jgi:23S rRNA (cytidine1920-2'-O)/16S rRNA (cytidine1409-2'-O)-methyltransferase
VKKRLDELLIEKGLAETRTKAQGNILAGLVLVGNKKIDKPGVKVEDTEEIRILGDACPFVSRGGLKIEKALKEFNVDVKGLVVADIGAGTGGFTDCLLQRGAKKVYAIDVGYGQIAWKLRQDSRVVVIERKNAREMSPEELGESVDLVVMDVSFISIVKIIPAISNILKDNGIIVTLVKPQFEAGRTEVPRGGVIRNKNTHLKVLEKLRAEVKALGYNVLGETQSPITGREGNTEFFLYLRKVKGE